MSVIPLFKNKYFDLSFWATEQGVYFYEILQILKLQRKEIGMPAYVTFYKCTGSIKGGGPERFKKVQEIVATEKG